MVDQHVAPETMEENDVVDLLLRQHGMIRDMFDEVERAPASARAEAFQRLVRLLAVHETAEEEIVHPYARSKLDGGHDIIQDRLEEEHEAKQLLSQMDQAGTDAPDFMDNLEKLRTAVLEHARSEERYEFGRLRELTTDAERRAMAAGVKAAEAMAPTHPHPGVESATKNILLGPPAAIIDRTRDVIRKAMKR
ncbi:hemerythrin superfamily protein [Thermocatellispora tengchongensis]|uniref:Hemerythrin superfamily protein n=1 Tax=Thermocatellispora tengchongensis TaxID=1073253 RepID=A0A840P9Q3_9ACTN|nr:hemerythrin domain-containing protein [Thermocatellispora tengchongensis]MBB5135739.1 hemerythrin superfamily protein [Thermocatellispora tengchongensis]